MKKNLNIKLLAVPALAMLTLGSCKKTFDFEGSNFNPYGATVPVTQNLLTNAMRSVPSPVNEALGSLYAQHLAEVQYTDASRFSGLNFAYGGYYTGPLLSLTKIIQLNSDPATASTAPVINGGSNANQIAIARILKAYFFFHITNRWGDIPYSEALQQTANMVPKFDRQQDVYNALFTELKEAANQFDAGATVKGDIFLSGNVSRWKLFANSLRLIMALRLSKIDPAKGKAEFLDAKAAGVITTSAQDFKYAFLAETANQNQWYARYVTRFDYAISKPFLDYLTSINDPRIPKFANKPTNGDPNYVGMPYGLASVAGINNNSVSYIGSALRTQSAPEYIIPAAHVLFTLAEGEVLGWNAAGTPDHVAAANYYLQGIEQSMRQYGAYDATAFATYVAGTGVAYDPAKAVELISYQRWIALYLNGYEAWNEWKRTGFPVLSPGPSPINTTQIPRRQAYSTQERDLNSKNYQEVVARQGADNLDTRMWWDKQ
jgi:hypothetical protein